MSSKLTGSQNKERYVLDPGVKPQTIVAVGIAAVILLAAVILVLIPLRSEKGREDIYYPDEPGVVIEDTEIGDYADIEETYTAQTPENMGAKTSRYNNGKALSLPMKEGAILTVGLGDETVTDALYLNPSVRTEDGSMHSYGIYIGSNSMGLEVQEGEKMEALAGETYILTNRTYDYLADCRNGVLWRHEMYIPGDTFTTTRFYFRVVDLSLRQIVGVAECSISFENGTFSLSEIKSKDAFDSGVLTERQREQFVNKTIDFLTKADGGYFSAITSMFYNDEIYGMSVIEKIRYPYFTTVLRTDGRAVEIDELPTDNLYAVSIPSVIGPVTVYFADQFEWNGFLLKYDDDANPVYSPNEFPYMVVAVDLLRPETEESIIAPK